MDAATRLTALQEERRYVLSRIIDLENSQTGLHPTMEKRSLMNFFERLSSKIRLLVDEVLEDGEDELGFVVQNGDVEKIVEGSLSGGVFCPKGAPETSTDSWKKVVVIFMKDEQDESKQ